MLKYWRGYILEWLHTFRLLLPLVKLFFLFFLDWVTLGRLLGLWWGRVWLTAAFGGAWVTHIRLLGLLWGKVWLMIAYGGALVTHIKLLGLWWGIVWLTAAFGGAWVTCVYDVFFVFFNFKFAKNRKGEQKRVTILAKNKWC